MSFREAVIVGLEFIFWVMVAGAVYSHAVLREAPLNGVGSAGFLFVAGLLVLVATPGSDRARLLMVGLFGFVVEVVGVRYGFPFGRYYYTEVLAPRLLETPLAMICAWQVLMAFCWQFVPGVKWWLKNLLTASLMTVFDLLIDPLAAGPLHFWVWTDSGPYYGIPWQNFAGWFGTSLVIGWIDSLVFRHEVGINVLAIRVGVGILVIYTFAAFSYGYLLAGVIGIGLLTVLAVIGIGGCGKSSNGLSSGI